MSAMLLKFTVTKVKLFCFQKDPVLSVPLHFVWKKSQLKSHTFAKKLKSSIGETVFCENDVHEIQLKFAALAHKTDGLTSATQIVPVSLSNRIKADIIHRMA